MSSATSSLAWQPSPVIAGLMGRLLLVLWPAELIRLLFDPPWLGGMATFGFSLYLLLAFAVTGWANRILGLALLLAIAALVAVDEAWPALLAGLQASLVFAAFLPAVYLLRSVLAGDESVLSYRSRVMAAPLTERPGWMLIGSHVLGAALSVGALAIMSPVLEADADAETRRATALATISGIALSLLWSPVFVAMAVVSEFMPQVPLWQCVLLGLGMAVFGLLVAVLLLGLCKKRRVVLRAVASLRPIIPMVLVAATSVVVLRSLSSLSTLESAALTLLPLALLLLLRQPAVGRAQAIAVTRRGLDGLGAEISIVSLAFALGAVMRASPSVEGLVEGLLGAGLPPLLQIALVVGGMIAAAAAAIHPIVAGSVLLAVFTSTDTGMADLILAGAVLLGWSCGAMVAVAGLLLMVAADMLSITRQEMILGRNMVLVLLFAATGTLILAALNAVFTT
ncbi:hypothetical protein [Halomonas korlensis]|uniref:Uncharacterized protein n=1 Tax=Halomonas korlensis TaxID=463301 RepID=A0A1I7GIP0_9GAMM|nr:hypothetical protein [Halomonas korlensis]SFU48288.1 hypothetical protein SAMN04487955_10334 [Halomonas korlensis]